MKPALLSRGNAVMTTGRSPHTVNGSAPRFGQGTVVTIAATP